jgi:hypothetical protein
MTEHKKPHEPANTIGEESGNAYIYEYATGILEAPATEPTGEPVQFESLPSQNKIGIGLNQKPTSITIL